ncbi:MAG: hypothetical protein KKE37_08645 [Verrucomicrobia bacterium]|nr:hypothetical protein [Verrucomicrobiota bacterium]MBU4290159.1 hypothetical protein [Verrucomicrobiota bacterium]MBU4429404.1 hypothetical protein [Verrucomicrobiota bacterium]MCG2681437.1 hypothetical protein [Kiritimatiellia bacterium]
MNKYDVQWTGIDAGREGLWNPIIWLGVLKIAAQHEGENVYDEKSPIYTELAQAFPNEKWSQKQSSKEIRPLFRDYPHPWTRTGVLDLTDQKFKVTAFGRQIVAGEIDPPHALAQALSAIKDAEADEYPFRILAAAFSLSKAPLTLEDVLYGVMRNFRPTQDNLTEALDHGKQQKHGLPETVERRIRHMLQVMAMTGAIQVGEDKYIPWNKEALTEIAGPADSHLNSLDQNVALRELVVAFTSALERANLRVDPRLSKRFVAAVCSKRFVILTGLSGSGKTKLAHAFASWLTKPHACKHDQFSVGREIKSDRISYYVHAADSTAIVLTNKPESGVATKVCLPRELVAEWVLTITNKGFTRDTPARTIREAVSENTQYSTQLNSFETHLKAAAFAVLEANLEPAIYSSSYTLIPVGADWTNKDPLFGYADALSPGRYCMPSSGALQLILAAQADPTHPYILILDEMNLSHVERYFADVLSATESGEPVTLHENREHRDGEGNAVPEQVRIPPNLFVIGTVNVDETTYMFSPKVLDRANVIEFTVSATDMTNFLDKPNPVDISRLTGSGVVYAELFVAQAARRDVSLDELGTTQRTEVKSVLDGMFTVLSTVGAEFGYRPAYEISRFVYFHAKVSGEGWKLDEALDAAIMQKLLPKLHGSKTKLGPVLTELKKIVTKERFPISYAKIERMELRLKHNGFTSYTEA